MSGRISRFLALTLLLGWLAPHVAALGVGMHLALEHSHEHHAADHQDAVDSLAAIAAHGHHHDLETTADHQHDARFDNQAPAFRTNLALIAVLPAALSSEPAPVDHSTTDRDRRRGSPTPLFTSHCALLL